MKRLILAIFAIFLMAGAAGAHRKYGHGHRHGHAYGHAHAGFGIFYSSLSSHGEWIETGFGTVWRPVRVGTGWRPYMSGRWVWSDYGWYWHSYEPFGWATYHYGRWIYDDYYGWIWVPDDVWGPAWVEWRYDNDYIGWAPLSPYATYSVSVGITYGQSWVAPVYYWNFVSCGNFSSGQVVDYIQPAVESRRIYGRTREGGSVRTVDRRVVNDGIGLDRVERRSRDAVRRVELVDRNSPGDEQLVTRKNRDRLEVYRPDPNVVREAPARRDAGQSRGDRQVRTEQSSRQRSQVQAGQDQFRQDRAVQNGQRSMEELRKERTAQRSTEQLRQDRTAQRSQEELQRSRSGQRNLDKEMREKVLQRDRSRQKKDAEAERGRNGVDRKKKDGRDDGDRTQDVSRARDRRGRGTESQ